MENNAVATRESQVTGEILSLERSVEELHSVIDMLDNRLSPVKRGDGPEKKDPNIREPLDRGLVPHAQKISDIKDRVVAAIRKTGILLDKIEL